MRHDRTLMLHGGHLAALPTDKGDIHVTHVIAAATMAYWGLWQVRHCLLVMLPS